VDVYVSYKVLCRCVCKLEWCACVSQVLKTDKDKEEAKNEEEMAELMEKHAKELQDLGKEFISQMK
jgi:hypothetical protein